MGRRCLCCRLSRFIGFSLFGSKGTRVWELLKNGQFFLVNIWYFMAFMVENSCNLSYIRYSLKIPSNKEVYQWVY